MEKSHNDRLRQKIAESMDRETVPDAAWEILLARGHVQELKSGDIDEETIVEFAKALSFYADLVEQAEVLESQDGGWEVHPPPSDGYEAERAKTLAEYLELRVAAHPGVVAWRRSVQLKEPLGPLVAPNIIELDNSRNILSGFADLVDKGTPPSGWLNFYDHDGKVRTVAFYKGSAFEWLRDLSEELRRELFRRWEQADAAWIIVTGKVREVPRCLKADIEGFYNRHLTYGRINLSVEPWISGETVLRTYQYLQALALRRRSRALSERNLAMTRWVMERVCDSVIEEPDDEAGPARVSWHRLMAWWNEEHPEWAFQDERNFFRDCRRTMRAVARPYDARRLAESPPKVAIP